MLALVGPAAFSQAILPRVASVLQNAELNFEVEQASADSEWQWAVLEPDGGPFLPGSGVYRAPAVQEPTQLRITLEGRVGPWSLPPAHNAFRVLPRLILKAKRPHLLAGNTSRRSVAHRDGSPGCWRWEVHGPVPAATTPDGPDGFRFTAPVVDRPTPFFIRVTDLDHPLARAVIRIWPWPWPKGLDPVAAELILETLMPHAPSTDGFTPERFEIGGGQTGRTCKTASGSAGSRTIRPWAI